MKIKLVLLALGCFAAGAAVGSIVTYKKMEAEMNAAIDDSRKYYTEKLEELMVDEEDLDGTPQVVDNITSTITKPIDYTKYASKRPPEVEGMAIFSQDIPDYVDAEQAAGAYDQPFLATDVEELPQTPYPIDGISFGLPYEGYDKIQLVAYTCGTLTLDENDMIIHPDECIGSEHLGMLQITPTCSHYFFRNNRLGTDFEVECFNATYAEYFDM